MAYLLLSTETEVYFVILPKFAILCYDQWWYRHSNQYPISKVLDFAGYCDVDKTSRVGYEFGSLITVGQPELPGWLFQNIYE